MRPRDSGESFAVGRNPRQQLREERDSAPLDVDDVVHAAEFRSALRRFLRHSELISRSAALTPHRYLLLLMIKGVPDRSEEASITELSDRLQLAQSTVTELVDRAEGAGLVVRGSSNDDARVVNVRLTDEGERRLALAFRRHEAERAELKEAFERLAGAPHV